MKRGWMLCGTLCAAIIVLLLAACADNVSALRPSYESSYAAYDAGRGGGHGGGAGGRGLYAANPPAAAARADEVWVVPVDDAAATPPAHAGSGTIAGLPIPGSPVLAAQRGDGHPVLVPLVHTDVAATLTGYVASVGVTQEFVNPYPEKIEAVYVFPLPENAGVNEFVMTIGDRHIRGIIRERADAEKIYRLAKAQGYVASMMTQEGANIFTQRVANIEPGKKIDVSVRYFHTLAYRDGWFEWDFPMVVGPRYGPGALNAPERKADVQYARPQNRNGKDISLRVSLDAGMPIDDLQSVNQKIVETVDKSASENVRHIELAKMDAVPNKDFVLRFKVAGERVKTGMFVQRNKEGTGGWFTAMLIPPEDSKSLPQRAGAALLTDVHLDFGSMMVTDVYPTHIPDLSAGKPLVIAGRFSGEPAGSMTISGRAGDQEMRYSVVPQGAAAGNTGISTLWARARLAALHEEAKREGRDIMQEAKATGLEYGIESEFTSFVTVDSTQATEGGPAKTVAVPVQVPEGVRYDMTVQDSGEIQRQ